MHQPPPTSTRPNRSQRRAPTAQASVLALLIGGSVPGLEASDQTAGTTSLRVLVNAPEGSAGAVALQLFDDRRRFEAGEQPLRKVTLPLAVGASCEWRVDGLPPGDYALKLYLDSNGNGRLDRGALGVPTEPYGFSNDARGRLGPASWAKARFRLGAEHVGLAVRLR